MKAGMLMMGVLVAGCAGRQPRGELIEADVIVPRDGAKSLGAALSMDAGTLAVYGGECALMQATMRYDSATSKPQVDYAVDEGGFGTLSVREQGGRPGRSADWTVCLTRELPVALEVDLGAGNSDFKFGGMQLRELDVDVGAGNVHVDLRGAILAKSRVKVDGGAGQMRLTLPNDAGVRVEIDRAVGQLSIGAGLRKEDGMYVNDLWGQSEQSVEVSLDLGAGEISIDVE